MSWIASLARLKAIKVTESSVVQRLIRDRESHLRTPKGMFGFVCVDAGFSGGCVIFRGSSRQCVDFGSTLNDRISSFGPDADQDCFIFFDSGRTGFQAGPIRNPGISNLGHIGFNDSISSFKFVETFPLAFFWN
ncbi:hypothetical protein C8J57DRAFT_1512163 [Mycena rebaudengoi]|nr:hypothetical protein C8J57DRAFT_1512163 [Mycena rebaudengoi]